MADDNAEGPVAVGTTNTIASDDDENNDHDDGDSAKWACGRLRSCKLSQPLCHGPVAGYDLDIVPRPESTELRKLAPGHALHLVYIIIIIQLYIRVYIYIYLCI